MKIVFLNSHPIQYFTPMYASMTKSGLDVEVWYCSDETLGGFKDQQFDKEIKWDIDLLEGYNYTFLKNYASNPSLYNGFWGLVNWGLYNKIKELPKNTIVITHGWAYFSNILVIILCFLKGIRVGLRAETPLKHELIKQRVSRVKQGIKKTFLRFLFKLPDYFFYIGKQNKAFYEAYGVSSDKLVFMPYCVDNDRFSSAAAAIDKIEARRRIGIPEDSFVFMYSGKFMDKKRPLDIIEAFSYIKHTKAVLLMVGEGGLRASMEDLIDSRGLNEKVFLTGFINQTLLPYYYRSSDVFVISSDVGETWGLVVNEAMNFALPVVIADRVGCYDDLLMEGGNGYGYQTGDVSALSLILNRLLEHSMNELVSLGEVSHNHIKLYSYDTIINIFRSKFL